jgi:hypothetical protein
VHQYRCHLFFLLSKLTSLKWSRCSRLVSGNGIKCFTFHLSTKKGKRNSKSNTCLFGISIGGLRMRDLRLSYLLILTSSLFLSAFFLYKMVIIGCRLSCFILTICTMMNLFGTSWLIPLSLILFMGLLSS